MSTKAAKGAEKSPLIVVEMGFAVDLVHQDAPWAS
jgi:hypothetical protein